LKIFEATIQCTDGWDRGFFERGQKSASENGNRTTAQEFVPEYHVLGTTLDQPIGKRSRTVRLIQSIHRIASEGDGRTRDFATLSVTFADNLG
jgi:hypothetical protein